MFLYFHQRECYFSSVLNGVSVKVCSKEGVVSCQNLTCKYETSIYLSSKIKNKFTEYLTVSGGFSLNK